LLTGGNRSGVIVRLDFFAAENIALTVEHVSGVACQNDPPDLLPWVLRRIQNGIIVVLIWRIQTTDTGRPARRASSASLVAAALSNLAARASKLATSSRLPIPWDSRMQWAAWSRNLRVFSISANFQFCNTSV
jgi:hypothetical protein